MYKILSVLLLLSALAAPAVSQRKAPPPPRKGPVYKGEPVRSVIREAIAAQPRTLGLTVEKFVSNYKINGDGTGRQTWEMQQKCSLEPCLAIVKKITRVFNKDLQDMRLVEAYVIKPDGRKVALPSAGRSLPTPQAEFAPGFSSLYQLEIDFGELAIGDSAYFKMEFDTKKPIFDKHFDGLETFPSIFDWNSVEINVDAPADYPLQFETTMIDGGPVAAEPGRARWRFTKAASKAAPVESVMYDPIAGSPRFALTSFRSFDELGRAFWSGMKEKAVVTPEIQSLADEITKDIKDPNAQAAAIYLWVNKNIRYLSVVLDRGGWVPHGSAEILRNGYGDCKDYTTIIYTLLKAKGIESTPVLINADFGNWFPKVATMDYFNHAILYVPGTKLFADATSPNTRLGIIPQTIVGKTAVLSGEKTGLIQVPKDNPDDNQLLSDVEVTLAENGDLKAVSKNTYSGRSEIAFRPLFGTGLLDRSDTFVKMLLAFYGLTGSGKVLSVSDPYTVGEPFVVTMEVNIPDFTTLTPKGDLSLPVGLNMFSISTLEIFVTDEKRNSDLFAGATRIRETFRIKLPPTAAIGPLPEPVKIANAAGTFTLSVTAVEGGAEIVREIVIAKDMITPAEYPQLKELISKAVESLNSAVAYTADPKLLRQKTAAMRSRPARKAKAGFEGMMEAIYPAGLEKKLRPAEVRRLEAKVAKAPDDAESRLLLVQHYLHYDLEETPAVIKARTPHRLWFIRNQPETVSHRLSGAFYSKSSRELPEYQVLRDEWLKQVAEKKANKTVRLNAADFVRYAETDLAIKLLSEGASAEPDAYEYPARLVSILASELKAARGGDRNASAAASGTRVVDLGKKALTLLKRERSADRDGIRRDVLAAVAPIAVDEGDLALAESLARELILDFAGDVDDASFDTAAHAGNITLGRVELARDNRAKAAEYLLISIRAPLRQVDGYFSDIDTVLAKELYKKGERAAVTEYLKLALGLNSFKKYPDSHAEDIKSIKLWIEQIEKGIEPTFDLDKPSSAPAAGK